MSKIYVAEYPGLAGASNGDGGAVAILSVPPTVEYTVIVSAASSGAAQPFAQSTQFVEISCDTTCSIAFGLFPGVVGTGSAGLTNCRLEANERIVRRVPSNPANTAPQGGRQIINSPYAVFTTANV
jgi:hypothetical protein